MKKCNDNQQQFKLMLEKVFFTPVNNDLADMCEHIDTNHGSKRRDAVESPKESGKKKKKKKRRAVGK